MRRDSVNVLDVHFAVEYTPQFVNKSAMPFLKDRIVVGISAQVDWQDLQFGFVDRGSMPRQCSVSTKVNGAVEARKKGMSLRIDPDEELLAGCLR